MKHEEQNQYQIFLYSGWLKYLKTKVLDHYSKLYEAKIIVKPSSHVHTESHRKIWIELSIFFFNFTFFYCEIAFHKLIKISSEIFRKKQSGLKRKKYEWLTPLKAQQIKNIEGGNFISNIKFPQTVKIIMNRWMKLSTWYLMRETKNHTTNKNLRQS